MYTLRRVASFVSVVAFVDRYRFGDSGGNARIPAAAAAAVPRIARSTTDTATEVTRRRIFFFARSTDARARARIVDPTNARGRVTDCTPLRVAKHHSIIIMMTMSTRVVRRMRRGRREMSTTFDAIKSWLAGASSEDDPSTSAAAALTSSSFTLTEYVNLLERAETERADAAKRGSSSSSSTTGLGALFGIPSSGSSQSVASKSAAELTFDVGRARAFVDAMSERERADPSTLTGARMRELSTIGTRAELAELLKTHALTRALMRRAAQSFAGGASLPTSAEAFADALRSGDAAMSVEDRKREASAMRGGYPGNRPCPCGSRKKFKRCCGGDG